MPSIFDPTFMLTCIAIALGIAAVVIAIKAHQAGVPNAQLPGVVATTLQADAKDLWARAQPEIQKVGADIKAEFTALHDRLSAKPPVPAVGSVFVDLWDVGEAVGASGTAQAVVIDGEPKRSGADPALVFQTDAGKIVRIK